VSDAPFRVVGERIMWAGGRLLRVGQVTVEGPGGEKLERDVLHHPGAVAVVPLHEDGTVTLVKQYRAAVDDTIWELPAGLRDVDGELPATTALRELVEEAGLSARDVSHLTTFHNSPGCSDETVHIFLATGLTSVPDDRQGVEEQHMLVERFSLADALAMLDDGRITDAKTVIGLLLTARSS